MVETVSNDSHTEKIESHQKPTNEMGYKIELVWRNVILMGLMHLYALYAIKLAIVETQYKTLFYTAIMAIISSFGIQCGAHRLWCHRSYKAKLPLQLILAFFQTMSLQNDIYEWSRDHRVHHKYSETDADPHNAKRGFFFSHVGWLLCKKHPDVKEKGKTVDMSDLKRDPLVQFQRKYYIPLLLLIWGVIPAAIPYYFWNETLASSIFVCVFFRYSITVNFTWLVNSASHMWGMKPYDKQINPVECYIRHLMIGEGFHNFHHTFAWDYSASEYGATEVFNPATGVIDLFAKIGWAYDLKKAPKQTVQNKMIKSGDITFTRSSTFKEWVFGSFDKYWNETGDPRVNDWFLINGGLWRILSIMVLYLILTRVALPKFMAKRSAYKLKNVIMVYNIFMASVNAYFFLFFIFTFDSLLASLLDYDYPDTNDVTEGTMSYLGMVWYIYLTKLLDLMDTVFFVLRKKETQITTLHLYHHTIVPIIGWMTAKYNAKVGILHLFMFFNAFIHTLMYGYYALSSLGPSVQKYLWWKKYITLLQIIQFVICGSYGVVLYFKQTGYPMEWFILNVGQNAVFLPLFLDFYLKSYKSQMKTK